MFTIIAADKLHPSTFVKDSFGNTHTWSAQENRHTENDIVHCVQSCPWKWHKSSCPLLQCHPIDYCKTYKHNSTAIDSSKRKTENEMFFVSERNAVVIQRSRGRDLHQTFQLNTTATDLKQPLSVQTYRATLWRWTDCDDRCSSAVFCF